MLLEEWLFDYAEDLFWFSTPRQVALHLKVAAKRHERAEESRRWHTWHAAALPKAKKFPPFKDFVRPAPAQASAASKRRQTPERQIEIAKQWLAGRKRR